MTLKQIISDALIHLGYGSDELTYDSYKERFIMYANEACRLIAEKYGKTHKETVTLDSNDQFDMSALTYDVLKIVKVTDEDGLEIYFYQDPPRSGLFTCQTEDETVTVVYEYYPDAIEQETSEPDFPAHVHHIIPYYIIFRARAGNDPNTQGNAAIDLQLFNSYLAKIAKAQAGDPESYRIKRAY